MADKADKDIDKPPAPKPASEPEPAPAGEVQALGGTAIKPPGWDRTGWEAFKYMLYDPGTGEVLTRTPLSWLKITVFYCIYYSFLAGFWIACLHIFFATLPDPMDGPRWQRDSNLIRENPGVGLRPRNNDKDIDSQMFVLKWNDTNLHWSEKAGEGKLNADYARRTELFLDLYTNKNMGKRPNFESYTEFDPFTTLGECGVFPYGYIATLPEEKDGKTIPGKAVTPCIIIKLNAIWDWTPEKYVKSKDTPKTLVAHLDSSDAQEAEDANPDGNVWLDCNGRYAADREALSGPKGLQYFPKGRNLPIKYFPYMGKVKGEDGNVIDAYHPPLVAIKISPNVVGQLIHIECRAYYYIRGKPVKHVTKTKEGLVQFEVHIKKY